MKIEYGRGQKMPTCGENIPTCGEKIPRCGGKDADMWSKDADMWWKTYRRVVKRCRQEKNLCDKANEDLLKQMKIYTSVRRINRNR